MSASIRDAAESVESFPIIVIGAGAAGLMAAIFAAAAPGGAAGGVPEVPADAIGASGARASATARPDVLVLERTRDGGRKILISGGGRCNVLPSELAPARFVTDSSPNTLRNLLRSWPLAEQRAFFERTLGVPLALEAETGKYFPVSDKARDVRDALVAHARRLGVAFRFDAQVTGLTPMDQRTSEPRDAESRAGASAEAGGDSNHADADAYADAASGPARSSGRGEPPANDDVSTPRDARRARWIVQLADGSRLAARAVILATGGLSVPATGSDGFGLRLLARLGHRVHEPYAALTPLLAEPAVHAPLSGVSLTVTLRASAVDGARALATTGGFLFTHRGYSGPSVLDVSHLAVRARLAGRTQPLLVQWTMQDEEAWRGLLTPGPQTRGTLVISRLRQHLPNRLAEWLAAEADLAVDQPLATLTREQRGRLVAHLCRYPLPWTADEGYKKAEVTGGGLALDAVDPRTLQSHRQAGLFCCGELLDAFGPIGGHNFAWAWATGRLAGLGAARLARA